MCKKNVQEDMLKNISKFSIKILIKLFLKRIFYVSQWPKKKKKDQGNVFS